MVSDAEVDALVRARAAQLVALLSTQPSSRRAELVVWFLKPGSTSTVAKGGEGKEVEMQEGERRNSMVQAASSLRAWASPRNYQYGWLAQAFSGGAGQAAGTFLPASTPAEKDELEDIENQAFEKWTISFHLSAEEGVKGGVEAEMRAFGEKVLRFVEENKAHLPAITSAELCTFPMRVAVRPGALLQP